MDFLAHLDDLAVLRIEGEDAANFLHTQLSNDILGMSAADARLAAYCSPKGRMLGNLLLWHEHAATGALLAAVKADITEPLLKRLRMFVLRAKVRLDVTPLKVYGVSTAPSGTDTQPWQVEHAATATTISAPMVPGGPVRHWLISGEDTDADSLAAERGLVVRDRDAWQVQDIQAGLGWVEQANVELFIPQSLNYDLIGGVSFTKGCYPGQEVVARAHFRGTVKRRGIPGHCLADSQPALLAGMDIFDAQRPGAPAGRIINAAASSSSEGDTGGWHLFMEVNVADIGHADFRALSSEGPAIRVGSLPYPLEVKE